MDYINHSDVLCSILKTRDYSYGCEVGVHAGDTTEFLLKNLPLIKRYYSIDPWKLYEMYDGKMYRKPGNRKFGSLDLAMKNYFKVIRPYKDKVITYQMTSVEASKHLPKDYLDWVFIDANHEYKYIKENLDLWSWRVKTGGVVAGHDYGNKWKGIKKAVDEFVPKDKLKIEPFCVWWYIK